MSEELKPCPFCGSDALSVKPNIHTGLLRVQCEACWAVTATSVSSNNRQTAIAAWNRRASPTPTPEGKGDTREAAKRIVAAYDAADWRPIEGTGNSQTAYCAEAVASAIVVARALLSSTDARREALEEVASVASECVDDLRDEYPEDPPRWTDCHCAGPMTERLADAIRALKENK